jgi:N-acetyl sugar amidotransferase
MIDSVRKEFIMVRCLRCGFPNTRPGLLFDGGVCQACLNFDKRKTIPWEGRREILHSICSDYRGKGKYDCLIPVSGGKDSYRLVEIMVKEEKMNPLLITVTDSFTHTKAGTHNLRNLITKYNLNHYQYTISHDLFKRATRLAFEDTGEPLKFVEYAIYTIPFNFAQMFDIPLIIYGENSSYEYGSTTEDEYLGNHAVKTMIEKMEKERPWWEEKGITRQEINSILPKVSNYDNPKLLFMSYFIPWSSVDNLEVARKNGFHDLSGEWDREGVIENYEQIDSVAYMVHLWLKYPKFGFQRAADVASRRVRDGTINLKEAQRIMKEVDPVLDGWAMKDFCDAMGYTKDEFFAIVKKHEKSYV